MLSKDEIYMLRCLQLAQLGASDVAPNPMVGAVIVYNDKIIGEGYHMQYGQAHAEVNCINSVLKEDIHLIKESTLYVSLEPCNHFGKTPPCTDLIIKNKIPNVVIGCRDSFEKVNGGGIKKLQDAGVNVLEGVLEKEALLLNKRFFTFYEKKRPYIILKWAQSFDRYIAKKNYQTVKISNEFTNRLVHQWRSEEAAIMVGTNTALHDNPSLTTRLRKGKNPVRIVIDKRLQLPDNYHLLDNSTATMVINNIKDDEVGNNLFYKINENDNLLIEVLELLYQKELTSVMIEGGAKLIQSFIDKGLWDEAVVITNDGLHLQEGIASPELNNANLNCEENILSDRIQFFKTVNPRMDFYYTIEQKGSAEYKDRGSKFLAFSFPITGVENFKKELAILKKEHSKAGHHCFAYRLGTDGNNFRSSDDGEPAGTAGKPILGQIDSKEITDIAIVVVRYFGGTLLGVPGLINAYKTVSSLVLQVVPILQKQVELKYNLHFDYTLQNAVMMIIKQFNCTVIAQEIQLFCDVTIGIPLHRLSEVLYRLNDLPQIELKEIK